MDLFGYHHFDGLCWSESIAERENKQIERSRCYCSQWEGTRAPRWNNIGNMRYFTFWKPYQNRECTAHASWISTILTCEIQIKIYGDLRVMLWVMWYTRFVPHTEILQRVPETRNWNFNDLHSKRKGEDFDTIICSLLFLAFDHHYPWKMFPFA